MSDFQENNSASMPELTPELKKKINRLGRLSAVRDMVNGKCVYVFSALVPFLIMLLVFVIRGIYPFGDQMYLRSDMYHQYCPFFTELWEKLRTGDSLFYTWDFAGGTNFMAVFGYYLSSPTNWFIALFPKDHVIELMNLIIVLKLCASSFTCTFYLCKRRGSTHMSAAIFGMFYALSAYIAAYSWNLMWLDCVLLLPLVILGLEKLVRGEDCLMYIITLGLSILSNYYIAIMVCISLVIYFVVYMISVPNMKDPVDYVRAFLRFALSSLLAGALAAILLLPEMMALGYTASGNINFPDTLTRYFSFLTIIKRELINVPVSLGLDHMPNIYCGVAVLVLFPLYIMTKKIPLREKIAKTLALVIFFVAFNLNIPNFIWHGFHYPNSLPCRQSFIYIFLLLTMCYDAVTDYRKYKTSQLAGSFWGVMLLFLYIGNTLTDDDALTWEGLYISAIFIALYMLFFLIARKKKVETSIITLVVYLIAIVECSVNMINTGYSTTSRTAYYRDYNAVSDVVDYMNDNDDGFYRTAKAWGYRTKNDSSWHTFHGPSTFSSTAYAGVTKLYGQLGLEHSTNAYASNGATPLVYSMLNIKYLISNKVVDSDGLFPYLYGTDGEFLYENTNNLSIGFMVNSDFNETWNTTSGNPFDVQNDFVEQNTGISDLFTEIDCSESGSSATLTTEADEFVYAYVKNTKVETVTVSIDGETEDYTGINHGRMIDLGYLPAGTTVDFSVKDEDSTESLRIITYTMDEDKYTEAMDILNDQMLDVTDYSSTYMEGTIHVEEDGLLFTSIGYDEGWTVTVDGQKVSYTDIADEAFIGVPLTAGDHTITFSYTPRGFVAGAVISGLSLVILGGMIVLRIYKKKHPLAVSDENLEIYGAIPEEEVRELMEEELAMEAEEIPVTKDSEDKASQDGIPSEEYVDEAASDSDRN